ncbi:MAG: VOC family protein [Actinomycetota bacterium]
MDYVILYVSDLEGAIAFYRDVIGLPFKFSEHGYAEFATTNMKFALLERARAGELIGREPGGTFAAEILIVVDDVDAEAARLRAINADILSGPEDRPWGHRTLHVAGPDGHVVELAQEIPRV